MENKKEEFKCKKCGKDVSDQPLKELIDVCHDCVEKARIYKEPYVYKPIPKSI